MPVDSISERLFRESAHFKSAASAYEFIESRFGLDVLVWGSS
jgi:hypothetical protein